MCSSRRDCGECENPGENYTRDLPTKLVQDFQAAVDKSKALMRMKKRPLLTYPNECGEPGGSL